MTGPIQFPEERSDKAHAYGHARATVDAEHRVEVTLLDAREDAIRRDLSPNRINETLAQLIDHATVHFISEQMLMRLTGPMSIPPKPALWPTPPCSAPWR